jgi:hypothetical protein
MHFGELVCPLLYSTHQLAQTNDAATNASKSVFFDETDKCHETSVDISTEKMIALPDVSASVAVQRRPKEVSPVLSIIAISTSLQFTYVSLTSRTLVAFVYTGLDTCESSGADDRWS